MGHRTPPPMHLSYKNIPVRCHNHAAGTPEIPCEQPYAEAWRDVELRISRGWHELGRIAGRGGAEGSGKSGEVYPVFAPRGVIFPIALRGRLARGRLPRR